MIINREMQMFDSVNHKIQVKEYGNIFILFCAWTYVLICRPQDIFPFLIPLRPSLILFVILCIYCITNNTFGNLNSSFKEIQVKQYFALFLVMVNSIFFSYYRYASFNYVFIFYSQVVFYFFLFITLVDDLKKTERILLLCCCGIGLYSIFYLIKGDTIDNRVSFGEMFDPNDIAYVVISFVMFNFYFLGKDRSKLIWVILIINIAAGFMLILSSGSRGGFIAAAIASAMLVLSRQNILSVGLKALMIFSLIIFVSTTKHDFSRFNTILSVENDYNVTGEEGRLEIWKYGIIAMLKRPLTGVGVSCFPEAIGRGRVAKGAETYKWQTAHNSLVLIGTETGVIGFVLFILLSFRTLRIFNKVRKLANDEKLLKLGEFAFIGFTGHIVASMFLSQAYSIIWAFYIALSVVLSRLLEMQVYPSDSAQQTGTSI
jgi:O-antigen ligase